MVEFYGSKSATLRPLENIKTQPKGIDLFSLKSPKEPRIRSRSLHLLSTISQAEFDFPPKYYISNSINSSPVPNFPSKHIETQNRNTHIFSSKSFTYSNFHPRGTQSVSSKLPKHPNSLPKPAKFQGRSTTHSAITKPPTDKKIRPKPANSWLRVTQLSPATLQVLTQIFKQGPSPDIITYTTFIKFLGDFGCAAEASELFALMKESHEPDTISFTVLIRILCDSKMFDRALVLLKEMPYYNCKPDIFCYNTLIDKLGDAGQEEYVWKLWSEMQSESIHPDVVTYCSLVKSLCVTNKIDEALSVLRWMEISGMIEPNTYVYNTIIKAYMDRKQIKEALGIFGRMEICGCNPDLCSFNLFIKYYSDLGEGLKAYMFLKWMIQRGVEANESSYRICIYGLMKQGKVSEVIELIEKTSVSGVTLSVCTYNNLILWLGKKGRLDEAYGLFLGIKDPDEITMNIVIHLLYKHGRGKKAWEVFNQMKERKIEASIVTYNILIHGLGREGRVLKSFKLVNQMEAEGRLSPDVVTYNCLLYGLCKGRQVDDACKLILEMSRKGCQPDLISYNTLINGMISIGRTDDASRLFEHMRGKLAAHSLPLLRLVEEMLARV